MQCQTDCADKLTQANTHKPVAELVVSIAIRVEGHTTIRSTGGRRAKVWRGGITAPTGTPLITIPCVTGNEEAAIERIIADQQLVGVSDVSSHAAPQSISTSIFPIVVGRHYSLVNFSFEIGLVSSLVIDKHYFCELENKKQ